MDEGELEEFLVALRNVAEAHDELGALSASRQDVYGVLFHEGCGLRTDLGELHFFQRGHTRNNVVDCGQTLVSYTMTISWCRSPQVVDCGQTLVSYTFRLSHHLAADVVDCGQTLVSYTDLSLGSRIWVLWIADRPW